MTETLDEMSTAFTDYAGTIDDEALDIGCAYGIATLQALRTARESAPATSNPSTSTSCCSGYRISTRRTSGPSPDRCRRSIFRLAVSAPSSHHASCIFCPGADVEQTVRKMYDWLRPEGRVFLIADSPYTRPLAGRRTRIRTTQGRRRSVAGLARRLHAVLPDNMQVSKDPAPINPMDPDILRRVCEQAGLEVIEARWLSSGTKYATGRDHAGVIARKP